LETNLGAPFTFVPKGWVNIRGPGNFCLNDSQKGKGITQGECGLNENALWRFISIGGNYIIEGKSKRVINDQLGKTQNGNPIISMDRHNGYNQKWVVHFKKNGALHLKNLYSERCLDNSNSKKSGSIYIQWTCTEGNQNQVYYLTPPDAARTGLTELTVDQKIMMHKFKMPTGWINFLGNTGLCLTENGKDKTVTQQVCSKEGKNNWKFKKVGNELYTVESKNGLVLTNQYSITNNGNSVIASNDKRQNNQKWNVIPLPNGKILLRNPESAKCVDIDGDIKAGALHLIFECGLDKNSQLLEIRSFTGLPINIINDNILNQSPNDITRIFKKGNKTCTCKKKKTKKFRFPKDFVNIVGKGDLCVISAAAGGNLTQGQCGEYSDALWKVTRLEKGNYLIVSKNGMVIENENGASQTSNPIVSGKVSNAINQRWTFHNIKGNKFMIEQFGTKLCMDISREAKKGNGYVQNDCLKGNEGEHFIFISSSGEKIETKQAKRTIKNDNKEQEIQRKQENDFKLARLQKKMKGEKLTETENKIEKAIKYVTEKIQKAKDPQKKKDLEKVLEDIKTARYKGNAEMEHYIIVYKDIITEVTIEEYEKSLLNIREEIKKLGKNADKKQLDILMKKEEKVIKRIMKLRKKEIKKTKKFINKLKAKKTENTKGKLKEMKKKIKVQKKLLGKERKEEVQIIKKEIKKLNREGKKAEAKKLKKEIKIVNKEIIKEKKKEIKRLEKKKVVLEKIGKTKITGKLEKKLQKLNKTIKKENQKKKVAKKVKEVKRTINQEINNLNQKGNTEKAKLLENILTDIKKNTNNPEKTIKKIEKAELRVVNIAKTTDNIVEEKNTIPEGYVNIVTATGKCIKNGKKTNYSYCGNRKGLSWKLNLVGENEYQIQSDDGKLLTNNYGNEIVIINQETTGRDESNIWKFEQIKKGQFIIINPSTNKCLETTNISNKGSIFTLEECKSSNNYQSYSFDIVVPEDLSKIKSDQELLEISRHWIQIVGSEELCLKSVGEGSALEQTKCQNNELELWRLIPMGENEYIIQNKAGFKISVRNESKNPKSIMSKYSTSNNEKFNIIYKSGKYMIKNNSLDKCIDTDGKPKQSGIYQMFKCKDDEEGQYFKFIKPTSVHLIEEYIQIVGPNFHCLKNNGKGKKLSQEECNDNPEFLWKFEIVQGNTFIIVSKLDESVIDLSDGKFFKGNSLITFERQNYETQKWIVHKHKKGIISIKSEASGTCLDAGKITKGSNYRIWDCSKKHRSQKFRQEYARPGIYFFNLIYHFL
jgi:hypothetical protein